MINRKDVNIPNIISACRIIANPVLLYFIVFKMEAPFTWLLLAAFVSDILDGIIARGFKIETKLGAALDSFADLGMYICAVTGLFVFKFDFIITQWPLVTAVLSMFVITRIINLIRYKKAFNSFHSYSAKIMAYLQAGFLMSLFIWGYIAPLFYTAMIFGICANMEEIILLFILNEDRENVKGLFWVLQKKN